MQSLTDAIRAKYGTFLSLTEQISRKFIENSIMKIKYQKIPPVYDRSFVFFNSVRERFQVPLHYHPEIEITEVTSGYGYRIIGEHQEEFEPGDLVLIGSRTYHGYFGYAVEPAQPNAARVLQFESEKLSAAFGQFPEFKALVQLLRQTRGAIILTGATRQVAHEILTQLQMASGVQSMLVLLNLLCTFAEAPTADTRILECHVSTSDEAHYQRFNRVFEMIHTQYAEALTVTEMAKDSGLSYSAFSRTFHSLTGRTFVRYLNEIRIAHVCRLLVETDLHIYQIANLCGFHNMSNFNRRFREIKQTTPQQFRQKAR